MCRQTQLVMALFCCFSLPGLAQLGPAQPGLAQQSPPPSQLAPRAEGATAPGESGRRITLDVVVTDKSGKAVPGLQQQDFTLLDDNQPQAILSFRGTDLATNDSTNLVDSPLQAILLVDAVNTSFRSVGYERQELQKFLQKDDGKLSLPTSLLILTDTSQGQSQPTLDGNALVETLNSNQSGLRTIRPIAGILRRRRSPSDFPWHSGETHLSSGHTAGQKTSDLAQSGMAPALRTGSATECEKSGVAVSDRRRPVHGSAGCSHHAVQRRSAGNGGGPGPNFLLRKLPQGCKFSQQGTKRQSGAAGPGSAKRRTSSQLE